MQKHILSLIITNILPIRPWKTEKVDFRMCKLTIPVEFLHCTERIHEISSVKPEVFTSVKNVTTRGSSSSPWHLFFSFLFCRTHGPAGMFFSAGYEDFTAPSQKSYRKNLCGVLFSRSSRETGEKIALVIWTGCETSTRAPLTILTLWFGKLEECEATFALWFSPGQRTSFRYRFTR